MNKNEDKKEEEEMDLTQYFAFGFDKPSDPDILTFHIPLKRVATDERDGTALMRGHFDEMLQRALKIIQAKRAYKNQHGVLQPDKLKVN